MIQMMKFNISLNLSNFFSLYTRAVTLPHHDRVEGKLTKKRERKN